MAKIQNLDWHHFKGIKGYINSERKVTNPKKLGIDGIEFGLVHHFGDWILYYRKLGPAGSRKKKRWNKVDRFGHKESAYIEAEEIEEEVRNGNFEF